ncbi:hypothetical protein, partial [Escherichia coli]|uniref:hypothetical protein n=1 Tax=Escherichia coli TaxID=562 RepID=UPI0028DFF1B0
VAHVMACKNGISLDKRTARHRNDRQIGHTGVGGIQIRRYNDVGRRRIDLGCSRMDLFVDIAEYLGVKMGSGALGQSDFDILG